MYAEPGQVVDALYQAVSFAAGESLDFDRLDEIFAPGARLIHVERQGTELMDLDQFVRRAMAAFADRNLSFAEREIWRRVDRFGHMAHVLSTYELLAAPGGPVTGRGVHSIQLIADGAGWRIATVIWQNEELDQRIPPELLPD